MHPTRRTVSDAETQRANRRDWDAYADEYQATHGTFLRDVGFVWCPEGLDEADARVLGDVAGRDVLEVGCGAAQCARCHGPAGEGDVGARLVGGQGTLRTAQPLKTVGSFWPYATTLWDYVNRAMPFDRPGSLEPTEVYAVVAYVLNLNGIIEENTVIDRASLPTVKMPNRDGFVADPRPDIR